MSKIIKTFLVVVVFMMGLSMGAYFGFSKQEKVSTPNDTPKDLVQDIVIKNVQSEKNSREVEEVVASALRISPYAKMIIEKKYTKCGHTTINILDVPKELINLSEDELKAKYVGWEVKNFSAKEFTLYRVIDANCEDHFVLKDNDGYVAVYNELTDDMRNLVKKTDILVEDLGEELRNDLEIGIQVYGEDRLSEMMNKMEI